MQTQPQAYTVAAITRLIKGQLEESFGEIWVQGEISNYTHHSSGHRYFSLKDDKAVLKAVIWKSVGSRLKFEPKPGQKVLAFGDINVYEKGGNYQLTCRRLVPVGMGELELAFRQLYEDLAKEGLFERDRKQPIPKMARKIGIVTSPTGAAIRDMIQIARRRNRTVELIIYPAAVQGDGAENSIRAGIEYFNSRDDIDIIITGRGGGSLEDLWPFNTEITVRAIANSEIPVISAVGHEVDITLADYVADLRAPTPSAGAELAVWSREEKLNLLKTHLSQQKSELSRILRFSRDRLTSILDRPVFQRPLEIVYQSRQYLDSLTRLLSVSGKNNFELNRNRLSLALARLDALSPLKTLERGYSVTRKADSKECLTSGKGVSVGLKIETVLVDGIVVSVVEEVKDREI
ncbi:MAG: exodeoxyribonuclease VII large subunit [bacterium]|nr:exodeoxyribonuclease VII large subunit [bacterium]